MTTKKLGISVKERNQQMQMQKKVEELVDGDDLNVTQERRKILL